MAYVPKCHYCKATDNEDTIQRCDRCKRNFCLEHDGSTDYPYGAVMICLRCFNKFVALMRKHRFPCFETS